MHLDDIIQEVLSSIPTLPLSFFLSLSISLSFSLSSFPPSLPPSLPPERRQETFWLQWSGGSGAGEPGRRWHSSQPLGEESPRSESIGESIHQTRVASVVFVGNAQLYRVWEGWLRYMIYIILVGECSAFLASGSDPTMLCTICLLRTRDEVKFLPPAEFQLFEAHCLG